MRPVRVSQTGTGSTNPVPLDTYIAPFNVSIGATVSGTVTYKLQYTYDDVQAADYVAASGNWSDSVDMVDKVAASNTSINNPVTAVRLTVTAGTGTVNGVILQSGGQ
jgi:hypothetical protein